MAQTKFSATLARPLLLDGKEVSSVCVVQDTEAPDAMVLLFRCKDGSHPMSLRKENPPLRKNTPPPTRKP